MCGAYLKIKNRLHVGSNMCFDFLVWEVSLICPAWQTDSPNTIIAACAVNQAHLEYFRCLRSAAIVSHILRFIAGLKSAHETRGEGRGGWDAAVAVSWLVTFHWRSLQGLLVPVWEIRERHEEAGWGETWSRPQIAPLRATAAALCGSPLQTELFAP